jgi:pimeloyl-ACP methyl ester carboxylesterase
MPTRFAVETDDHIRISVLEWLPSTPAQPTTVLFAHANGFHAQSWEPIATQLALTGHRCLALDFRSHGESGRSEHGVTWTDFAHDIDAVLRAEQECDTASPIVGVGHSLGATALLIAAGNNPNAFAYLWCYEPIVFADTPPSMLAGAHAAAPSEHTDHPLARVAAKRRATWPSIAAAREAYGSRPPLNALHPDALDAYVHGALRPTTNGEFALRCSPSDEAAIFRMDMRASGWDRLDRVTTPTTIACGSRSDTVDPEHARAMAAQVPNANVDVWDGAGHFGPLEDPVRAAEALQHCIQSIDHQASLSAHDRND